MSGPTAGDPIFEDLGGRRFRRLKRWGRAAFLIFAAWAVAMAVVVLAPGMDPAGDAALRDVRDQAAPGPGPDAESGSAGLLINARADGSPDRGVLPVPAAAEGRPRCIGERPAAGAAVAATGDLRKLRVHALVPGGMENAFLPLLRNCNQIDVILPEWFEISGASLAVSSLDVDPEMLEALAAIRTERPGEVGLWPIFGLAESLTAEVFVNGLADERMRAGLADRIVRVAKAEKAQAVCLRLGGVKPADLPVVAPFFAALADRAHESGMDLCLIAALADQQWASADFVAAFDKVIVSAYQEPWIGSYPQPLAPLEWFAQQVKAIQASVPDEKLVVAVGGHAVDWISGRAVPERISLAEAMFRISEARASVEFSPRAGNSHASFFDRSGNRHQIWMLDAAAVHNSMRMLQDLGIADIAVPSLGEEEPAYWSVLEGRLPADAKTTFGVPAFPDNVVYTGEGSFYRLASVGTPGRRLWRLDPEGVFIRDLRYDAIPRPVHMERYGRQAPRQIALTFDDGPNPEATGAILDALKAVDAPATFFVVGTAALAAPEMLQRAVDEGHTIGSHSFSHPHMDDLGDFMARTELSANRSLIEGVIGRTPLLYRPPYTRGPGPLNASEALAFAAPNEEGHVVVGSDLVPPDWQGVSAAEIVRQVIDGLGKTGGNVIVLHDGRATGMHTAEAVRLLVPELRARGYEIVPVAQLLGMTPDAVMPRIDLPASVFKGLSVSLITLWILFLTRVFWLCIFASVLRSLLYLFLSARRDPVYPRNFAPPPSVTVVVPAYNEEEVIVSTVRSVLDSDYPELVCLVVDDGSTDGTLARLNQAFADDPRVRVLTQANRGKWQALNLAFQSIDTEIAVCVDADTRIARDAISEIVRPFADSKVAAVAGTVVVANTRNLLTRFQSIEYVNAQQIGRRAQEHLNGILVVPGALGAWRVEAVRDVGLFSHETLTEDADLTIWLRRAGYRIAYAENARSYTEAPTDVRSLLKQRLRWSFGNLQTLWKHRGAFREFGPRRVFSMLDMVFFGYVLPILSPILDALFLYFLTSLCLDWYSGRVAEGPEMSHLSLLFVAVVQATDILVAVVAHRRQRLPVLRLIYQVPLMNLLYRPLLYITVYRALWAALSGRLARWNKLRRQGLEPRVEMQAR